MLSSAIRHEREKRGTDWRGQKLFPLPNDIIVHTENVKECIKCPGTNKWVYQDHRVLSQQIKIKCTSIYLQWICGNQN